MIYLSEFSDSHTDTELQLQIEKHHTDREREREAMEVELKEMLNDLESLKQSLPDPSHRASIDKVFFQIHSYSYVCMYMSSDEC